MAAEGAAGRYQRGLQALEVAFLSQITDHHGADDALTIHCGGGDPALAVVIDLVNDRGMQRVELVRAPASCSQAQIQDRQNLGSGQLKVF